MEDSNSELKNTTYEIFIGTLSILSIFNLFLIFVRPNSMAGQVDYATHGFAPATEKAFKELGVRILRPPIFSGPAIVFNMTIHPFEMPEFRKAVAYGRELVEDFLGRPFTIDAYVRLLSGGG